MTEIRFYHMEKSSLEQTLPSLLGKALSQGHKIMLKTSDTNTAESLSAYLWTYDPASFLPHGTPQDAHPENQPILITDKDENINAADVLILTHSARSDNLKDFKLCCEMLNGNNPEDIQSARERWKTYKEEGFEITYWQQTAQNGWEKKSG